MGLLSEFSQLVMLLKKKFEFCDHGRIQWSVDRKLPTLNFCPFLDNVQIIVNKICFWKVAFVVGQSNYLGFGLPHSLQTALLFPSNPP